LVVAESWRYSVAVVWIENSSELPALGKGTMVIISSISKQVFRRLLSTPKGAEVAVGEEVEWFADRDETILGAVGFGGQGKGWNYAILKRDSSRGFLVYGRQEHFSTHHTARVMLLRQMTGVEKVGVERLAA
jgi:hypothetical protein